MEDEDEYEIKEFKKSAKNKDKTKFFERHGRFKKLLIVIIIIGIILIGFNTYSYLRFKIQLNKGIQPDYYNVVENKLLIPGGGRMEWSPDGQFIYYDAIDIEAGNLDGIPIYTLYRYNVATTKILKLINSSDQYAPSGNKGQPAVSPDGNWLLFQGEYENHEGNRIWAEPGKGKFNNLWILNLESNISYQLTDYGENEGVLHPHFDNSGLKLCYSHLYSGEGFTGSWEIIVADFSIEEDIPNITNVTKLKPEAGENENKIFYETHGFSKDNQKIIYSSDVEFGAMALCEIYTYNLFTNEVIRLTHSFECHDEHAIYNPTGDKISWISNMQQQWNIFGTDLFLMDSDGSNKVLLVKSQGRIIADNSWSPDGDKLVYIGTKPNDTYSHNIYIVIFKGL